MNKIKRYFKSVQEDLTSHYNGKNGQKQYKVGEIFKAEDSSNRPEICTASAIHFYDELWHAMHHYGRNTVILEVKTLPGEEVVQDGLVCGSRYIEVTRVIPKATLDRYAKIRQAIKARQLLLDNHKLQLVREIQSRYPELILCGSAAVFLHTGKVYERNRMSPIHDLDFVSPYYVKIEGDSQERVDKLYNEELDEFDEEGNESARLGVLKVTNTDKWGSGNDFDECIYINNVPCDIAINPSNKYEYVTFQGFRYKVASLPSILEAKLKYANQGSAKHMQDISDLINLPKLIEII